MYYQLYIKHASRALPERTQYYDVGLTALAHFARGYIRGINDASRDGRYTGIVCDDQGKTIVKITKEGAIRNA